MASQFDTIFSPAVAALQACHGDGVICWPCGRSGAAVTVAGCLWTPDESPDRMAGVDADQTVYSGTLQVPIARTPDADDVWVIGDECYATLVIGDVHAGLRTLSLKRVDKAATARHQGRYY